MHELGLDWVGAVRWLVWSACDTQQGVNGALLFGVALAATGQVALPPIDPVLPASLRTAVEQASEAELDPKRGADDAISILRAARERQSGRELKRQLDLRVAGTMMRAKFINDERLSEARRAATALSTFEKLDLLEPGVAAWIERAIAVAPPEAKARLMLPRLRRIRLSLAVHGTTDVGSAGLIALLARELKKLGFELLPSGPKDADVVAVVRVVDARDESGQAVVRASLDIRRVSGPQPRWKRTLLRDTTRDAADSAEMAGPQWLMRMGGKEMLFAWLESQGLEGALMSMPRDELGPPVR